MPAPYNHGSGLAGVYDRSPDFPDWARVLFREDRIAQAAEMMESQSIIERRNRRIADRVMRDGDRIEGADIVINAGAGTAVLREGRIYARGDVRYVGGATLTGVPMTGEISIGVRIISTVITEAEEPALFGLHPGSEAEGEGGAGREVETVAWGFEGDGEEGDLYQVYLLKDGVAVDQTPPPSLTGINQAIALYDRDAHGSYVVRGCAVQALGRIGGAQHFSIGEGVANILGFKRSRDFALRHIEPEQFDTDTVDAEPHTFADGGSGSATLTLNRTPLDAVVTAIVTKQKTVSLVKGTAGSLDLLPDNSVTTIVSVTQGGTTYVQGVSWTLNADRVDWTPAGPEPATGSTYSVTYRYLDAVIPTATTDDTVTLTGGVTNETVLLSYRYKLPRYDLLCLGSDGLPVYVKGLSTPAAPRAPSQPSSLLALAEIRNTWRQGQVPEVVNTDVRSVPYIELWAYLRRLVDALDLIALERLRRDVDSREPVAKKGVFVDPWEDDFYRDQGEPQTAAIFDATMRLAIDPTITRIGPSAPVMLDYTEQVVIRQEFVTGCMKINPYQNFEPIPGAMTITPATDFWTQSVTQWLSEQTRVFGQGDNVQVQTTVENLGTRRELLPVLRQIQIAFTINGFGPGEQLSALTFDGLNVTPAGPLVANASGVINGTFMIPANVPAGTKLVRAAGAAGSTASARFVGQGRIEITTLRRVRTINRFNNDGGNEGGNDPLAQTFTLTESRHICGVDLRFCAIGDRTNDVIVEIHPVENGWPTAEIVVQKTVNMQTVALNAWTPVRFDLPVFLTADREWCIMVKTDDANHSLSIGRVGGFDTAQQRWVGAQPYAVGVLLSSSNALTWTAHQNEDLTFRLVAARFAPTTKTIQLGTVAVTDMSDLLIRAGVELPTADASVFFEVERADGSVTRLFPGQPWQLTEFVTEDIDVRAVLRGSDTVSPILYPDALFIAGKQRESGTYVSRTFEMGASIRMSAFVKTRLPPGSTLTVEIDAGDDDWDPVAQFSATAIDQGWIEREYRVTPYSAPQGRVRLTITGTPAARPLLSDFRAVSV